MVLGGVCQRGNDCTPEFVKASTPTDEDLHSALRKLTRRGVLIEEEGSTCMANNDGDSDADIDSFSLPAAVRCAADNRQVLKQPGRYITRPATGRRARADQRSRARRAQAQNRLA